MSGMSERSALVIGATGSIGGALARRLLQDGWRVRALHRDPEAAARRAGMPGLEWVRGDAMEARQVTQAAEGAALIVHGANPPAYRNWRETALPMLASSIAAARAHGGRILFPGTVYNFGPDAFPRIAEGAAQRPRTRKGAIRAEMELALKRAAQDGVRSLIVRAGDFFGPLAGNSWFSLGLIRPGRPLRQLRYPGPIEIPHAWGYLPDLVETFARLARLDDLADFEVFHLRGHEVTGAQMAEALSRVTGRRLAVRRFPWWAVRAAAPFNETFREMLEMTYLWRRPVVLDNARLVARLGAEPHTPLDAALAATLDALGCGPPREAAADQRLFRNASSARRESLESVS